MEVATVVHSCHSYVNVRTKTLHKHCNTQSQALQNVWGEVGCRFAAKVHPCANGSLKIYSNQRPAYTTSTKVDYKRDALTQPINF